MTSFSTLASWLVVLVVAVVGVAAGVVVVRRITPRILSAAATTAAGTTTDGALRGTAAAERDDPGTVGAADDDSDRDEKRTRGRIPERVAGGRVSDEGAEETVGPESSRTRASDGLLGYVALGLGFLCLVGLVLLDGVYAEQLTVIGILLYGLVLLVFYEQLGSATPTPTPAPFPVAERSDAEASGGESGRAEGTVTDPPRTDASAGSEAADGDGSGAPPKRHGAPTDGRPVTEHRPVEPEFPRWNENGTWMPAWGWSRTERRNDVFDRDRRDSDELTPDDLRDGGAESSDIDDADDADDADPDAVSEFACEYCGRDDFESAPQRNGHLRWCDAYDPNAPVTDDGGETAGATAGSGGTTETDDEGSVRSSLDADTSGTEDADTSGTEPAGEVGATAETAGDDGGRGAEPAVDETGEVRTLDVGTTVERDTAERDAADEAVETDTEEPGGVEVATVAGAASMGNDGASERGDAVATAPNAPPESGRSPAESTIPSAHTFDEQSIAVPASTVSAARRHLRAGRLDEAVYSAYRSVREELCAHNDIPAHRTHREFSAACREVFGDDDSVEALDRLVAIYERLYYADDTDTDRIEIETLLDRLVDAGSSRS